MTPELWRQVEKIFHSALQLPAHERVGYLDQACAHNPALRREVESLLAADHGASGFLTERPPAAAAALARLSLLAGRIIDDKYRIEKLLGEGGMGAVYRATHLGTKRPVALKVIAPQFMSNEEFVNRFQREAEAAGRLIHPNVVNVTDFGTTRVDSDRLAYLVMEYLEGCTLGTLIKQQGRLALPLVIDITEQICLAIGEAHKQGIIHRDLKPDNIWLQPDGRGGYNVKVLDFGLAKLREGSAVITNNVISDYDDAEAETVICESAGKELQTVVARTGATEGNIDTRTVPEWLTRTGVIMGTPLYMSPEQCHGQELDARSDIYSLGVIVYEMLSGTTPFKGDFYQLIAQHTEKPPQPIRERCAGIPKGVAAAVMSALAKQPDERPASPQAFITLLRINAEGEVPILREAIAVYRNNFVKLAPLSLLISLPFLSACLFIWQALAEWPAAGTLMRSAAWLASLVLLLMGSAVNSAALARIIEQVQSGKQQINVLTASYYLLRSLPALINGGTRALLSLPGSVVKRGRDWVCHPLLATVIVIESVSGSAALARTRTVSEKFRHLLFMLQARELMSSTIILIAVQLAFLLFSFFRSKTIYNSIFYLLISPMDSNLLLFCFTVPLSLTVLIQPVVAIAYTLLYYKSRVALGDKVESSRWKLADASSARPAFSYWRTVSLVATLVGMLLLWGFVKQPVLLMAIESGNSAALRALIAIGADMNVSAYVSRPILHKAIMTSAPDEEAVKLLLAAGADVNARDYDGSTPLIELINRHSGNTRLAKILIDAGADLNVQDNNGNTALLLASSRGNTGIVMHLLEAGADVHIKDKRGRTAIFYEQYLPNRLVEKGADINTRDNNGTTPLIDAAATNNYARVDFLIKLGADVNARDNNGVSAVMAGEKSREVVEPLLRAGAKVDPDKITRQIAEAATNVGRIDLMKMALGRGNARTILDIRMLIELGDCDLVQKLIDDGYKIEQKDEEGNTLLMKAAAVNNADCVQVLIDNGLPVNATDNDGNTALFTAAHAGNKAAVRALLANGANPNIKNSSGDTALLWTVRSNKTETAKLLLAAGANARWSDRDGTTALMWAAYFRNVELVKLLAPKSDVNARNNDSLNALMMAIGVEPVHEDDALEINKDPAAIAATVKLLLAAGIKVNVLDNEGDSALMMAAANGHKDAVVALIKAGADVNQVNKQCQCRSTPLTAAHKYGHSEIVKILKAAGAIE